MATVKGGMLRTLSSKRPTLKGRIFRTPYSNSTRKKKSHRNVRRTRRENLPTTKKKGHGNVSRTGIENLPIDLALEIFSRLPIASLLQSRHACGSWRIPIDHPRLPFLHYVNHSLLNPNPTSVVIWTYETANRYVIYYIPDIDTCEKAIKVYNPSLISYLQKFEIIASLNGFIFLANKLQTADDGGDRKFVISNPVRGDWIILPPPPQITRPGLLDAHNHLGFGFCPKTSVYKVIRLQILNKKMTVDILTVGSNSWRSIGPLTLKYNFIWDDIHGVFVNGHVHWLAVDDSRVPKVVGIHAFNVEEERFEFIPVPHSIKGKIAISHPFLEAFRGFLTIADTEPDPKQERSSQVWAMKDYRVESSWVLDFTIPYPEASIVVRHLKELDNGNLLLQWGDKKLTSYDPKTQTNKELTVDGLPNFIRAASHVGTFVKMKDVITTEGL